MFLFGARTSTLHVRPFITAKLSVDVYIEQIMTPPATGDQRSSSCSIVHVLIVYDRYFLGRSSTAGSEWVD
jgi:hypothetical protein